MSESMVKEFEVEALSLHPIFKIVRQPEMAPDSMEFISLVEDVRRHGVMEPLKVTAKGQIMDGRHRWRAAKAAGLDEVPVRIFPEEEALSIVASSIAHRRHYTKAALAYVMWPMAAKYMEEGKRVSSGNLKRGKGKNPNDPPKTDSVGNRDGKGATLGNFSAEIGVSDDYLRMAADLHGILEVSGDKLMRNGRTIRDAAEEMLFSLDKGFQPILAMIGFETKGSSHAENCASGSRSNYARYIRDCMAVATKHFTKWDSVANEDREDVLNKVRDAVATWPKDVRSAVVDAAMKARA